MLDLIQVLKSRLMFMEHYAKQGVIPGELDSIELEQMIGRIKELKFVLYMLSNGEIVFDSFQRSSD
jgi:hypothetical protein